MATINLTEQQPQGPYDEVFVSYLVYSGENQETPIVQSIYHYSANGADQLTLAGFALDQLAKDILNGTVAAPGSHHKGLNVQINVKWQYNYRTRSIQVLPYAVEDDDTDGGMAWIVDEGAIRAAATTLFSIVRKMLNEDRRYES